MLGERTVGARREGAAWDEKSLGFDSLAQVERNQSAHSTYISLTFALFIISYAII